VKKFPPWRGIVEMGHGFVILTFTRLAYAFFRGGKTAEKSSFLLLPLKGYKQVINNNMNYYGTPDGHFVPAI